MTLHIPFDNTYARLPSNAYTRLKPMPVKAPVLLRFNDALAADLGIILGEDEDMALAFSGNAIPDGADPLAQAYAGHQFGGFSPQLGDGRANLLGEVLNSAGQRFDIQLKGSGPTPYSRMGDGRAWLGPVLREYVVSEAMHALGIPTSRALAAVATGESVYRENGALPGAVLTRVASSHIRVGTFQFFAARRDVTSLQALFDYAVARHYPQADGPTAFLEAVIARQARLVAQWMGVGFIHGVMNTDNTTISGETIDYGPCAFMDVFHPDQVFSSIDAHGRYAYSNQPHVIVWNMAQLATCLVLLMPDADKAVEEFTRIVHAMPDLIQAEWRAVFGRKIGIAEATAEDDALIEGLLRAMAENRADFTNTFRALGTDKARDQFLDPKAYDAWEADWQARIAGEDTPEARMQAANPAFIARNHRIEQMIQAAVAGDYAPMERLLDVLSRPFEARDEAADLARPPEPSEVVRATFCGT
ncbi:YdiU family protein [Roseovarius faecimaris]|uniref:Protein nucleotidyltransferase YdiU n=1 Tax=Roseovarius faecimaris TaxID=2494550 RepID=A0A6I6IQU4_9RHOB|nr:YdiU family protein [Roseovarius faecimaris]QGX98233.1 YdiU family protein [Roseovarius faecimaris]